MNWWNDPADDGDPADEDANPEVIHGALSTAIERVLVGSEHERAVEHLTIALLTRGHVLLEGVPGVAKTTLAELFARASGLEYNRIQMTPDVLPADITGTHVYRENTGEFELRRGPIFGDVIVADEINRATPKTQSALLEAMQERTVTIDGDTRPLDPPFIVVATRNPIEMDGVFELPEAQRDRFQFALTIDLPNRDEERALVDRFDADPTLGPDDVDQVVQREDLLTARDIVADVHVESSVRDYLVDLVHETRAHPDVTHGASPRATRACLDAAKAHAAIDGRGYVIPDDVKSLADSLFGHRLVLSADADLGDVSPHDVVAEVVDRVEPPKGDFDPPTWDS